MNDKPASKASAFSIWLLRLYAFVLGLTGAAMLCGGVWLVYLGGSFYYATAGTSIVASAILLFTRCRAGAWLYGFTLAFTTPGQFMRSVSTHGPCCRACCFCRPSVCGCCCRGAKGRSMADLPPSPVAPSALPA
ncbi:hypothetical protein DXT91_24910 [Agrobacterium tumefaciens]|nr:hypothetical protein [Agrobacterium tumefaciens]